MTEKRLAWDEYFAAQALLIANRSTCKRAKVGAVLVKDNKVISTGYNGSVSGTEHCIDHECLVIEGHCVRTLHAEVNAILQGAERRRSNYVGREGRIARRILRRRGEAETPTSNQPPCVNQGRRLLGPAVLRT